MFATERTGLPPRVDLQKTVCGSCACGGCEENEISGMCLQCEEALCSDCMSAHRRVKMTRDHEVTLNIPSTGWILRRRCPLHPQETLRFFCLVCKELTCKDCQLIAHRGHGFLKQEEALESEKQQLQSLLHSIKCQKEKIRSSFELMEARLQNIVEIKEMAKKMLTQLVQSIFRTLVLKASQLLKEVYAMFNEEVRILMERKTSLSRLDSCQDYIVTFIDKVLSREGHTLLFHRKSIESQAKKLLSEETSTPDTMMKLHFQVQKGICQYISKFLSRMVKFSKSSVPFSSKGCDTTQFQPVPTENSNANKTDIDGQPPTPPLTESFLISPELGSCFPFDADQMIQRLSPLSQGNQPSTSALSNQGPSFQAKLCSIPSIDLTPYLPSPDDISGLPKNLESSVSSHFHQLAVDSNPPSCDNSQPKVRASKHTLSENEKSYRAMNRLKSWTSYYYPDLDQQKPRNGNTPSPILSKQANNEMTISDSSIPTHDTPETTKTPPDNHQTSLPTAPMTSHQDTSMPTPSIPSSHQRQLPTYQAAINHQTPVPAKTLPDNHQRSLPTVPMTSHQDTSMPTPSIPSSHQRQLPTYQATINHQTPVPAKTPPDNHQRSLPTVPVTSHQDTSMPTPSIPSTHQRHLPTYQATINHQTTVPAKTLPDNHQRSLPTVPMTSHQKTSMLTHFIPESQIDSPNYPIPADHQVPLKTHPIPTNQTLVPSHQIPDNHRQLLTAHSIPTIHQTTPTVLNANNHQKPLLSNIIPANNQTTLSYHPLPTNTTNPVPLIPTYQLSAIKPASIIMQPMANQVQAHSINHSFLVNNQQHILVHPITNDKPITVLTQHSKAPSLIPSDYQTPVITYQIPNNQMHSNKPNGIPTLLLTQPVQNVLISSQANIPLTLISATDRLPLNKMTRESSNDGLKPNPMKDSRGSSPHERPIEGNGNTCSSIKIPVKALAEQEFDVSSTSITDFESTLPSSAMSKMEHSSLDQNCSSGSKAEVGEPGTKRGCEKQPQNAGLPILHRPLASPCSSSEDLEMTSHELAVQSGVDFRRLKENKSQTAEKLQNLNSQVKQIKRFPCVSLVRLPICLASLGDPIPDREMENSPLNDVHFCTVCQSAGAALQCKTCDNAFHLDCHIPAVLKEPRGAWVCLLCQDINESYDSEEKRMSSLSLQDQRRCEQLLLGLLCEGNMDLLYSVTRNHSKTPEFEIILNRLQGKMKPSYRTAAELVSDLWSVLEILLIKAEEKMQIVMLQRAFEEKLNKTFGSRLHTSLLTYSSIIDTEELSNKDPQKQKHTHTLKRMREFFSANSGMSVKKLCLDKEKTS
ncbi:hypothetical protein DNTS_029891 [Danionella cerebrum]|uniref:B box-type domain-containing protein n=1 Tax=Danionella cerebrum TaxID=2873325 RepID=A0A553RLP4_9TELE|nr:hypothetical protein DNTS_029891 [Danionella translucida]